MLLLYIQLARDIILVAAWIDEEPEFFALPCYLRLRLYGVVVFSHPTFTIEDVLTRR